MQVGHIEFDRVSPGEATDGMELISHTIFQKYNPFKCFFKGSPKDISIDIWFALSFIAAIDAFAVALTFNAPLIRKFHNAVSQRLVFLASILSWAFFAWLDEKRGNGNQSTFISRYPVLSLALGIASYMLLGVALDSFEKRSRSKSGSSSLSLDAASRRGSFAQFSKALAQTGTSWTRTLGLMVLVVGAGLLLTSVIPPPWSAALPVAHIMLEYITLCSPAFVAIICVHWGVTPLLANSLRLCIHPILFLFLCLLSRLLLDFLLNSTLRSWSELHWARNNVLISTPKLILVCGVAYGLECTGVRVLTFVKPLAVTGLFGGASLGYSGAAAYGILAPKGA
ncbi:uncharacterized protein BDV14DRAFT_195832 [Aspergillus stella-maris]|uniref:uncharacterized protein n=1 Tax=Aspergillus stella-maris TaxID=1810926 RepID=UPI003CCD68FB